MVMKKKILSLFTTLAMICSFVGLMPVMKVGATQNRTAYFSRSYTLGDNPAQNMINIAYAQIGKTGSDLGYSEEWCANFVSDCADLAGQSSAIPRTGAVRHEYTKAEPWYGLEQTILNAGGVDVTSSPQPGDIVFFSGHVEIVYSGSGSTLKSIGGNTSSAKSLYSRVVCSPRVHGGIVRILRPNYNGSVPPTPDPVPSNDDELGISYPRPSGNPLLKNGSAGGGVSWLQTALNMANNAGLSVDGQFGSATKTAVTNFQSAYGLEVDGIAGPATINKLVDVIKNKSNVVPQIRHWVSPSKMGDIATTPETYNWYYICYELLDKNTSQRLNGVTSKYNDYTVTESIYSPDGSLFNTCTYTNSDNNWIGFKPSAAGTYKYTIEISGNGLSWSGGKSFEVVNHTHSYGSWTTTKSATCTTDGSKTRSCSICGSTETATISRTGHNWSEWWTASYPSCADEGKESRTCYTCTLREDRITSPKNNNHSFGLGTSCGDGYVKVTCERCGYYYKEKVVDIKLTCDNKTAMPGDTVKINLYADSHGYSINDWALGIEYDTDNIKLINIECDKPVKSNIESTFALLNLDIKSGDYLRGILLNPETPMITYTFKILDNALPGNYGIKLTGVREYNQITGEDSKRPDPFFTYTNSSGNIVAYEPTVGTLENAIKIECIHQYTTKVIEPTCTEEGYTLRTCSVCGYSYKSNYVDENGHHFADSTITKSATCTADGEKIRKCSDCGKTETVAVPAIGHQYDSTVIAPSYTAEGYTLHVCSVCGDSYKDNYVEKEKGDLNNDNFVLISDIVKLQQYLSNSTTLTEEQYLAADMNNDGQINAFDAIIIRRKMLDRIG